MMYLRHAPFRLLRSTITALCVGVPGAAALTACGTEIVLAPNYGVPPEGGVYNPGNGQGSGPYGYGSGMGSGGASSEDRASASPAASPCAEERSRCEVVVTYPVGQETAVEIRGDFRGAASWKEGVAMKRDGAQWRATLPVPVGKPVLYKLCINPDAARECAEWRVDTTKTVVRDASGNPNNQLAPTTCETTICEVAPDAGPAT